MSDCKFPFTDDEIRALKRLANADGDGRTMFDRSQTVVRSCRISKALYDDAILANGRDFTEVVERALWRLVDNDPKYLRKKKPT